MDGAHLVGDGPGATCRATRWAACRSRDCGRTAT